MLGALGGVTLLALILSRNGVRGGVVLFWVLFAVVAYLHTYGVPSL